MDKASIFWFFVTLIGQWAFAAYVAIYHGSLILKKGLEGMGETHMPNGYISGDNVGNLILGVHLITAVVVIAGGPLQLLPQIQFNFPKFHRYLGRAYMLFVLFGATGGAFLIWMRPRPSFGSVYQDIAITIEAFLIVLFAVLALRYALARKIQIHKKWALQLFMVASGVWFLRIGYKAWFFVEALLGFKLNHSFDYLSFASFMIPLFVLEFYLKAKDSKNEALNRRVSILIFLLSLYMALGILLAITEMWVPRILKVF